MNDKRINQIITESITKVLNEDVKDEIVWVFNDALSLNGDKLTYAYGSMTRGHYDELLRRFTVGFKPEVFDNEYDYNLALSIRKKQGHEIINETL